jgi:hypothetical protein
MNNKKIKIKKKILVRSRWWEFELGSLRKLLQSSAFGEDISSHLKALVGLLNFCTLGFWSLSEMLLLLNNKNGMERKNANIYWEFTMS